MTGPTSSVMLTMQPGVYLRGPVEKMDYCSPLRWANGERRGCVVLLGAPSLGTNAIL